VFENRVLRRIFGSRRDEVTGEGRKLHNYPFGAGITFFNFSTPVYKMLIIQEPNTLEL
jgi:hypothetical protein